MQIINLNSPVFTNPFINTIEPKVKSKYEVISRDFIFTQDDDIITAAVIEQIRVKPEPKKEVIQFLDYNVRIGNRLHEIQVREEGTVFSVLGREFKKVDNKREFIVANGQVLFIAKDYKGNKYLVKE